MDLSPNLTPLPWNGLVLYYIYRVSKGVNPSRQMEELQEACVKSTARMYLCKVCDKSFTRKIISLATCSFFVRKGSKAIIVQNITANKGNLKSTPFITT